jgi:hypothetical protein
MERQSIFGWRRSSRWSEVREPKISVQKTPVGRGRGSQRLYRPSVWPQPHGGYPILARWSIINKVNGVCTLRRNSLSRHQRVTQWKLRSGFWSLDSGQGAARQPHCGLLPPLTTPVDESMTDLLGLSKLKGRISVYAFPLHALFGISIQESLIQEHVAAATCYQGRGPRPLEAAYKMLIYLRACHFAGRYSILSLDISRFSALWRP